MLGKYVKEFAEKVKEHKFWIPPWWANKETTDTKEELISYWNSLFGTPHLLEQEFVSELLETFGFDKAKKIIRQFKEDNFHVVKTMKKALNKDGTIQARTSEPTGRVVKDDEWRKDLDAAEKKIAKEGKAKNLKIGKRS